jgi:hypothetical protein
MAVLITPQGALVACENRGKKESSGGSLRE